MILISKKILFRKDVKNQQKHKILISLPQTLIRAKCKDFYDSQK